MVSMRARMKPTPFSESTGLERKKAGHGHPHSLSRSLNMLRVLFPGQQREKYFGQLKRKGSDKARERRRRGKND